MKRSLAAVVLTVVFVGGLGLRAEAASGITCGAVLPSPLTGTKTYKLNHDLTCSPAFDPAIALSDNTVLDLNGHTLNGSGSGHGVDAVGKDHVTVKNGTIKNFNTDVFFTNGNKNHATGLTLKPGGATVVTVNATSRAIISNDHMTCGLTSCVSVLGADASVISSNTMSSPSLGVKVDSTSTDTLVSGNHISASTIGVDVNTSGLATTRVVSNVIRGGTTGIEVAASGVNETITGNDIGGASSDGIHVASGAQTIAVGNNVTHGNTHDGIFLQNSDGGTSVGGNTANNNGNYGIEATAATDDAGGDKAKGNGQFGQCIFVVCT